MYVAAGREMNGVYTLVHFLVLRCPSRCATDSRHCTYVVRSSIHKNSDWLCALSTKGTPQNDDWSFDLWQVPHTNPVSGRYIQVILWKKLAIKFRKI